MWVAADLYGADRTKAMYTGLHAYGWKPGGGLEWRWAEAGRTFADFDKLMRDPKASADALMVAAEVVAGGIAADMRR